MRVLLVVQRYGPGVVGGSEQHARTVAGRLARRHEVEIATTTAQDYWTWSAHYPEGEERVDGLVVRRFPVAAGRDARFKALEQRVVFEEHTLADERDWLRAQGPSCPALLEFLHRRARGYDAVLFYTYIYEPTALGLPIVPERAALVSTAHDEAPLALAPYRTLFQLPRAFGFLTPEERDLVRRRFHNEHIPDVVLGVGLDEPPPVDAAAFRARFPDGPLVAYLGQVSEGKGVDDLIRHWCVRKDLGAAGTLVLAGTERMKVPDRPDIVRLGRVSEEDKWALLAAADALVLPSRLESLGIVLLEAWQVGTPVLVPLANPVTAGQVTRSEGGAIYEDDAFDDALDAILAEGRERGAVARRWVRAECAWEAFDARLEQLLELVA